MSYPRLLGSILRMFIEEPLFRARSLLGFLLFAAFSMLWTTLTFLLSSPPYEYSTTTIGLFGLAGAAGAYAANRFGRLADRGLGNLATRVGLLLLLGSWGLLAFGQVSVVALLAGILIQDLAIQGVHVTNSSALYRLRPEARSRLTAGYMTCYFIGGATGFTGIVLALRPFLAGPAWSPRAPSWALLPWHMARSRPVPASRKRLRPLPTPSTSYNQGF